MASYSRRSCIGHGLILVVAAVLFVQLVAQIADGHIFYNTLFRSSVNIADCRYKKKVLNVTIKPDETTIVRSGVCVLTIVWEDQFRPCKTSVVVPPGNQIIPSYEIKAGGVVAMHRKPEDLPPEFEAISYWDPEGCTFLYEPTGII